MLLRKIFSKGFGSCELLYSRLSRGWVLKLIRRALLDISICTPDGDPNAILISLQGFISHSILGKQNSEQCGWLYTVHL